MAGPIVVSIIGDNKKLAGAVDSSNSKLGSLGSAAGKAGKAIGVGLLVAGAAAVKFGIDAAKSASDAQQSLGATRTVFGKYADDVIKRSEQASKAIGVSANEYRELSNVTGASLKGAGVPLEQVSNLTDNLNKRAADLAATFGGPTKDAVSAFGSLLRGEADPIERYGISVKQSDVNARLAAAGQDKLTGSALKQAEMMARLDLAFMQSTDSAGAFGRESDTLANRQQVLGAMWEDLKAKAGSVLLPALTSLATFAITTLVPAMEKLGPPIMEVAGLIGAQLGPAVQLIGGLIQAVAPVLGAYVGNWIALGQSLVTNALPALQSAGGYLVSTFGPILADVGGIIINYLVPGLQAFGQFVAGTVVPIVVQLATKVGQNLRPVLDAVAGVIRQDVLPAVRDGAERFREWWPTIQKVVTAVLQVVGAGLSLGTAILGKVLPPVINFAGFLLRNLIPAVAGAIGVLINIAGFIIDVGQAFVDAVQFANKFGNGVRDKVGEAIAFVRDIPGKIKAVFSGAGDLLLGIGRNIIDGLVAGIRNGYDAVIGAVQGLIDKIPGPIRKALGIASPSKVMAEIGRWTVAGLVAGLAEGAPAVASTMTELGDKLAAAWEKRKGKPLKAGRLADVLDSVDREVSKLKGKAREYQRLADTLDKARQLAAGVRSSALQAAGLGSVSVIETENEDGSTTATQNAGNIIAQLNAKLFALRSFQANVDKLRQQGLSQASVDQIIAEGVEKGSLTASAIVAGGPQAIAAVNQLQAGIDAAASQLGETAAVNMYGTGQQATDGFIKGLQGDLTKLEGAAKKIAKALVKAIKKELGIRSPSRVARQLARQFTDGIVVQTHADSRRAQLAGEVTAKALLSGFGAPRAQLTADALQAGAVARAGAPMSLTLSAEQLDQLARGRQLRADLDAWETVGGRTRS